MAGGFDYIERLGSGYFGEVWLVNEIGLDTQMALKVIPEDKIIHPDNFFHEAQVLKSVQHPNVVQILETGRLDGGRLYVAMEYLTSGSVEDEAKGAYVPLTRAKRLTIDMLRGLESAHDNGILHRDIKPGNVLVGSNGEGKLSDFGLAMPIGADLRSMGVKAYAYQLHLAPEIVGVNNFSITSDIYAVGVTLYRLVNGDEYLPQVTLAEARALAKAGQFPDRTKYRAFIPRPLRTVINKAVSVNPDNRYQSVSEMRRDIERLTINKNWQERMLQDGVQWMCGWDAKCYEITRRLGEDGWSVVARKGSDKEHLRRIVSLCQYGLSKAKAVQYSKRLLQDYVLGKHT